MVRLKPLRWPRRTLCSRVCDETAKRTKASAVVFAPHQDDETLGCGGTMILKRQAGTRVACVFLTDGRTSHQGFMEEDELRRIRKAEALEAAKVVGIAGPDVHFLDFEDSRLRAFHGRAVQDVLTLIERYRPDEVYVPHRTDGTPDHEAAYAIVTEACRQAGRPLDVCEYPVWSWNQWPWVSLHVGCGRDTARELLRAARAGFGWRLLRAFRSGVLVAGVIERKRQALAQYRSQMTVMREGTAWPTLSGVSGGEFLECFFQEFEVFRCETVSPTLGG